MTSRRSAGQMQRSPWRPRRLILLILVGLLASSGVLRLTLGLNEAWAVVQAAGPPPALAAKTCSASVPADGKFLPLVEALKTREARVAAKEASVADRSRTLARAKQEVEAKLAELKAANHQLSQRLTLARGAAEGDVAKLTAMYANMKPKMAAAIFQKMAPDFAAGFLARMKPEAAALILSGLTPDKAYTVSVMLAGRNAAAPKN